MNGKIANDSSGRSAPAALSFLTSGMVRRSLDLRTGIVTHVVAGLLAVATILVGSGVTFACGPFTLSPVFSLSSHADFPLEGYLAGEFGIVPDSFDRLSLFPFYRALNGAPLTANERRAVKAVLENEIFYRQGVDDPGNRKPDSLPEQVERWLSARAAVNGEKREIDTDRRAIGGYEYYSNCLADSFRTAARTLESRITAHGRGKYVSEWLKGQDDVFSNCGGGTTVPAEPSADAPVWLRKDRDYQIAAALMYSGALEDSRDRFEAIARDADSPWQSTARFVVARTLIRQARFVAIPEEEPARSEAQKTAGIYFRRALAQLEELLRDPKMQDFHPSAARLTGLVKFRLTPEERKKELAAILSAGAENPNIYDDLNDFEWLNSYIAMRAQDAGIKFEAAEAEKAGRQYDYNYEPKLRDLPAGERADDLTDWLFTYQAVDGYEHAVERWRSTRKLHWFVAAIAKAPDASDDMFREARKIGPESPAFATVRYNEIRLLIRSGQRAEARRLLDEVMASGFQKLPRSTQNRFLAQRTALAADLSEFLTFAQRRAAIFDWDENGREEGTDISDDAILKPWKDRTMFDHDAVAFLNEKVPISTLRAAALDRKLPDHLRGFLASAVWVRAFVLGDAAIQNEFAPIVSRLSPEVAPYVSKFSRAAGPLNKEAAALLAILRYPVLQPYVPAGFGRATSEPISIDSLRGNWWCVEKEEPGKRGAFDDYRFRYPDAYPQFLTDSEKARAEAEQGSIAAFGPSATGLTKRAVEFAERNPRHPLVPELLHFAVRSTRYGCTDDATGRYSKQAFDILHKRYPRSAWTARTPYWFGDQ